MGRPLNKRLFGANERNNIKVQFHNGDASVPGYIFKQKGSKRFLCFDKDGNYSWCHLVDKASADLQQHEMTITVKYDNGDANQITKIAAHRVTVDGTIQPWSFSTSTSDGKVQMEEAGTDLQLTDNTDLEGDDFNTLTSYPVPGSGNFLIPSVAGLPGYSAVGSPAEPTGSITDVTGFAPGLLRNKYLGNFSALATTAVASWNFAWFSTATVVDGSQITDTYAGFGNQSDLDIIGGHNFSLQSKGWIKPPVSQNYNFYGTVDDQMAMWIGNEAKTGFDNTNATCIGKGGGVAPAKTVYLDATKWYPVRLWMGEFQGGCQEQLFAVGANNTKYGGPDFTFKYNPQGFAGWDL